MDYPPQFIKLSIFAQLIRKSRLQPPTTKMVYLGILFDTVSHTISIPDDMLAEVVEIFELWTS